MAKPKPSLAKGTRDYTPSMMVRRYYIIDTIKETFQRYGFLPLETPSLENLSVLLGKYGEEGDQLLFRILNSGDFLKKTRADDFQKGYKHLSSKIAEKGLRYDLTVPFARFVVMHQHDLAMPFKRYQIQPVWRGDSPQRGRYREFYQCDADVVGTGSLLCEAEIILMINRVMQKLRLPPYTIKLNNRKILTGIAEQIGAKGKEGALCVAIDKLDKIGREGVTEELQTRGFTDTAIRQLAPIFDFQGTLTEKLTLLEDFLGDSTDGQQGLTELKQVFTYLEAYTGKPADQANLAFDVTLARGLSYYTGAIFEVKVHDTTIGSISGGGRYDNLTGAFGLPDVTGVGFSFGLDRIYDVMEEFALFPAHTETTTQLLFTNFDATAEKYLLPILEAVRAVGINAEIYPSAVKLDKQLKYANRKGVPYVVLVGSEEMATQTFTLKNMEARTQETVDLPTLITTVKEMR